MKNVESLVPPPPVIRHKLADNIRERRILKSLLKLALKADEDRHESERREQTLRAERDRQPIAV